MTPPGGRRLVSDTAEEEQDQEREVAEQAA
jgi:hypothetical protein